MLTFQSLGQVIERAECCPFGATAGFGHAASPSSLRPARRPLYSLEERQRRDASPWTVVQGVLAPVQFAACLASAVLVIHYLVSDSGYGIATASIILKTALLYAIMITGAIWERAVFGRYLFAPAFFWEDVVSILVLALHSTYLVALFSGAVDAERQMWLALAAYASYAVNATQFLLKLRAARRQQACWPAPGLAAGASR
jgi:3-vinyl bacteriochlorophyllide hydratase